MGPIAAIVLREPLSQEQLFEMETVLKEISSRVEKSAFYYREFSVIDTAPIGGDFVGTRCNFGVVIINPDDPGYDLDFQIPSVEKCFGFAPRQKLQFDAGCNSSEDHRILGLLILYFAEKYRGIVDFGGVLLPRSLGNLYSRAEHWPNIATHVDAWLKQMPGEVCTIEYEVSPERKWALHIADVEFLRAWLKHPDFYMLK